MVGVSAPRESAELSDDAPISNRTKYESYKEAWRRMSAAREQGFFLEAITIQESIIFDRLRSFAEYALTTQIEDKTPYSVLVGHVERALNTDAKKLRLWDNDRDLIRKLKNWGDHRNRAVHRIVRSRPGTPTQPIDEFLEDARQTADDGAILARQVSDWFEKQKRSENPKITGQI